MCIGLSGGQHSNMDAEVHFEDNDVFILTIYFHMCDMCACDMYAV